MRTWDAPTLARFLEAERGHRYHPLWVLMATTGCRRGEALGLRWSDVDLDAGTIQLRNTIGSVAGRITFSDSTKSGGGRPVKLDAGTVAVLKAWRKKQTAERLLLGAGYTDHGLVFCRPTGEPPNPNTVSWIFTDAVRRHGPPRIRVHDLRHTWATLALEAGVHPKVVQERLGHSSIAITLDLYSHVVPAMDSDAAERVAGMIFGGAG
jgi:integrase